MRARVASKPRRAELRDELRPTGVAARSPMPGSTRWRASARQFSIQTRT